MILRWFGIFLRAGIAERAEPCAMARLADAWEEYENRRKVNQ